MEALEPRICTEVSHAIDHMLNAGKYSDIETKAHDSVEMGVWTQIGARIRNPVIDEVYFKKEG